MCTIVGPENDKNTLSQLWPPDKKTNKLCFGANFKSFPQFGTSPFPNFYAKSQISCVFKN